MELMNQIIARAKADMQRIVLPEGTEERTLKAADKLIADKVAHITLIGNPAEIMALAEKHGLQNIGNAIIVDPKNHERKEEYANLLFELRKKKGMTEEQAAKQVEDPLFLLADNDQKQTTLNCSSHLMQGQNTALYIELSYYIG